MSPSHKIVDTAPPEAVAEMAALGVTIAINSSAFPKSIDVEFIPGSQSYVRSTLASLYFSPHSDFVSNFDFSHPERRDYPYAYFYSQESGDEFIIIPPVPYSQNIVPNNYDGDLQYTNLPKEFVFGGDHSLFEPRFKAPINATHIELWHRVSLDVEPVLLRRVPLSSLFAWRKYVQPLINANE